MPVTIFFCYAHEDEALLNKLKTHLRSLQRQHLIDVWHDRDISAGTEWEKEIDKHLNTAQIILLLISPDFMASDYCYGIEMKRAIERHKRGEARVIPIILRPVHWQVEPLGTLQALPTDAKPVTDPDWHNLDRALFDVTEGIRKVIEKIVSKSSSPLPIPTVGTGNAGQAGYPAQIRLHERISPMNNQTSQKHQQPASQDQVSISRHEESPKLEESKSYLLSLLIGVAAGSPLFVFWVINFSALFNFSALSNTTFFITAVLVYSFIACLIAGYITGKSAINGKVTAVEKKRSMGFLAGTVAGITCVVLMVTFPIGTFLNSSRSIPIKEILIVCGVLLGLLGSWLATCKHPYYVNSDSLDQEE